MDAVEAKKQVSKIYGDITDDEFYLIDPTVKNEKKLPQSALIYGEFPVERFPQIMHYLNPREGEVFFDLGSGIGKLLIYLALIGNFSQVTGIEAVKEYCEIAKEKIKQYKQLNCSTKVTCIYGDFLQNDLWVSADIVFAYATCFNQTMMEQLAKMAQGMTKGSRFVSINMPLKTSGFKQLLKKRFDLGHTARAEVFIYEKSS